MAQMYCSKRYRDQLRVKSQKRCIQLGRAVIARCARDKADVQTPNGIFSISHSPLWCAFLDCHPAGTPVNMPRNVRIHGRRPIFNAIRHNCDARRIETCGILLLTVHGPGTPLTITWCETDVVGPTKDVVETSMFYLKLRMPMVICSVECYSRISRCSSL
jgi:hypothetical protein